MIEISNKRKKIRILLLSLSGYILSNKTWDYYRDLKSRLGWLFLNPEMCVLFKGVSYSDHRITSRVSVIYDCPKMGIYVMIINHACPWITLFIQVCAAVSYVDVNKFFIIDVGSIIHQFFLCYEFYCH